MRPLPPLLAAALAALALLAPAARAQASWDAEIHLLPDARVAEFGAKCLDGSAPGYYIRRASSPASATKWKFHQMGGGWCTSVADCASRAKSLLGSSATWPQWLSALWPPEGAGFYGLMDANLTNPFGGMYPLDKTPPASHRHLPLTLALTRRQSAARAP